MDKKLQVFVSSTYIDLIEERQAAIEAILDAGHIPAGMELFKAGNRSQLKTIYKWIDESDVYMLILGGRYGSIEEKSGLSYTQLEYEYALSKNIPVFAVVLSELFLTNKINSLGFQNVLEQTEPNLYKAFKTLVMSKIIRKVDDCKDIKITIHSTLNQFLNEYDLAGWTRNIEYISTPQKKNVNMQKYDMLNKRIQELEKQLNLKTQQSDDNFFEELIIILKTKTYNWNLKNQSLNNALDYFMCYYNVFCSFGNNLALTEYDICSFLEEYEIIKLFNNSFMITNKGKLFIQKLNDLKLFPNLW